MIRALRLAMGLASFTLVFLFAMQAFGLVYVGLPSGGPASWFEVPFWVILGISTVMFLLWFLYLWSTVPYLDLQSLKSANEQLHGEILERKQIEAKRAKLQEQLHQAQKMEAVGELATGMAHDFNNLLTVIHAGSDVLKTILPSVPEAGETLRMIDHAIEQATRVSRSLMTYSRRMPFEKKPIELALVAREATRMIRQILPATIELILDSETPEPLWVSADSAQIQQVLLNLSINARDAMPEGGTLRIHLEPSPMPADSESGIGPPRRYARLLVADSGVGMTPETHARIFEPFFTTKPRGQGTGLGLAAVLGIIEDHQGRIQVQSKLGEGTSFTIDLPIIAPGLTKEDDQQILQTTPLRGSGEVILLAEDDPYVRAFMASTFFSLGYETVQAEDGLEFVECYDRYEDLVQLFVVDVDLPKRSGIDGLGELRSRGVRTPAIVITGNSTLDLEGKLDDRTILLRKPFTMSELSTLAQKSLGNGSD